MSPHPSRRDDGNAVVELVPVALAILALLTVIIVAGRLGVAGTAVSGAASEAARQASIARTPGAAQAAAIQSAQAALRADGLDCDPAVTVNTAGFSVPVGEPAQISATVTCNVRLSGLLLPGLPGSRSLTATAASPLDTFRGR